MYRLVHTGAKIKLGGVKNGLFSAAYHVGIALRVTMPEIPPRARHIPTPITVAQIRLRVCIRIAKDTHFFRYLFKSLYLYRL